MKLVHKLNINHFQPLSPSSLSEHLESINKVEYRMCIVQNPYMYIVQKLLHANANANANADADAFPH
jgi:predicted NodU family carbamoyl transferase